MAGRLRKGLAQGDPLSALLLQLVTTYILDPLVQRWEQRKKSSVVSRKTHKPWNIRGWPIHLC